MNRKDLKQAGKSLFKKNYWCSVLIGLLMLLVGEGAGFSVSVGSSDMSFENLIGDADLEFFLESPITIFAGFGLVVGMLIAYFIFMPLYCGGIRYFLKTRKNQSTDLGELTQNFKDKTFLNVAKISFLKDISVLLWSLLFIIPGIIKAFEYWAINYILAVRPDIDRKEAHRLSKILMDGNKWDCFVLGLSFLGWSILGSFTFGLLNVFFVNPYMQATFVEFFSDLRLQALAKGTITPNDIPDYEVYNPFYQNPFDQPQYQPTFQQNWNNPYAPQGSPAENNFYAPQQPVQEPIEQPVAQPTEPVVEEPVVETPIAEPVAEETVAEPIIETTEPAPEETNE